MKIIRTHGSFYETGLQQGQDSIKAFGRLNPVSIFREMSAIQDITPIHGPIFNRFFQILTHRGGSKLLPSIKEHLPKQFERMRGLADGFGVSLDQVSQGCFLENMTGDAKNDTREPRNTTKHVSLKGCTGGIIQNAHDTIILKNYDVPWELNDYQIVRYCDLSASDGYKTLGFTEAPLPGVISGMNEHGLCSTLNIGFSRKTYPNRPPASMFNQECLETCRTVEEAVSFWRRVPIPIGWMILMADATDNCTILEVTPNGVGERHPVVELNEMKQPIGHYLAASNTMVTPEGKQSQVADNAYLIIKKMKNLPLFPPSNYRMQQMEELLKGIIHKYPNTRFPEEELQRILQSHNSKEPNGGDATICRHACYFHSLSGFVYRPKSRQCWLVDGHPCEHTFQELPLL